MRTRFPTVFLGFLLVAGLLGFLSVASAAWNLFFDTYEGDAMLFFAVGRAIRNGLLPYVDIFENKPPGIFLLSALSLWWNNGHSLAHVAESGMLVLFPVLCFTGTWMGTPRDERDSRLMRSSLSFLFGCTWMLFAARLAGGYYTEFFGAFFAGIFVLIAAGRPRPRPVYILCSATCILLAVGFKESFIFSLAAAALLLTPSWKVIGKIFLLPAAIAAVLAVLLLLVFGYARGYFGTYLPHMLFGHATFMTPHAEHGPLQANVWMRGFLLVPFLAHIWSRMPFVCVTVLMLWTGIFLKPFAARGTTTMPFRFPVPFLLRVLAASILAVFSAQMSGDSASRQVVMLPFLVALSSVVVFSFDRKTAFGWNIGNGIQMMIVAIVSLTVMNAALHVSFASPAPRTRPPVALVAEKLDAVLDACGIDRYLFLSDAPRDLYGYTRHSPWPAGPMAEYVQSRLEFPLFATMIFGSLAKTDIAVVRRSDFRRESILNVLERDFTTEAPPCAKETPFPTDDPSVEIYYRKKT